MFCPHVSLFTFENGAGAADACNFTVKNVNDLKENYFSCIRKVGRLISLKSLF